MEEQYQEVTQMIKDGVDFEQFAENMDNGYHSDGHVYISMDCIEGYANAMQCWFIKSSLKNF